METWCKKSTCQKDFLQTYLRRSVANMSDGMFRRVNAPEWRLL